MTRFYVEGEFCRIISKLIGYRVLARPRCSFPAYRSGLKGTHRRGVAIVDYPLLVLIIVGMVLLSYKLLYGVPAAYRYTSGYEPINRL
ncbi:hypothetical protein L209DRAFT_62017 [Thermothelomyces heterothallicus CBS 203.75]